ncbi:hypothetical protein ACNKF0_15130 [Nocardioides sp. T5]|uniref:hypothetical protein n=1 Tax=Nocardioides sp. T5 TaxID=3400182 RepID=UPI003A89D928
MSSRTDRVLARPPVSRHRAVAVGVVVALALVGVAVIAVRDLAVTQGWAAGEPWLDAGVRGLDGLEPTAGVLAVATAVGVLGLLLVLAGLLPARRRHVPAAGAEHLWSTPAAVAEVTRGAVDRSQGVVAARVARASRGRVALDVVTHDGSSGAPAVETARELGSAAGTALGARRVDVRTVQEEIA